MPKIRIAGYMEESIVDGPGIRFTLFVQGCPHHCKGCHNPHTWSTDGGYIVDTDTIYDILKENPLQTGITFSGGEPMCQDDALISLAKKCKEEGYSTIMYTGYTFDEVKDRAILKYIDYLIDGRYIEAQRSLDCLYRGSENQRIIDIKASIEQGRVIEVNYETFGV